MFDTRITRTAELLMYCTRLYSNLGMPDDTLMGIHLQFTGLKGRVLTAMDWGRDLSRPQKASEDELVMELREELGEIKTSLPDLVKELLRPLFMLFEYQEFADKIYIDLVEEFLRDMR